MGHISDFQQAMKDFDDAETVTECEESLKRAWRAFSAAQSHESFIHSVPDAADQLRYAEHEVEFFKAKGHRNY